MWPRRRKTIRSDRAFAFRSGRLVNARDPTSLGRLAVWIAAPVVLWAVYLSPRPISSPEKLITYLLGAVLVAAAARRPDRALLTLLLFLPFQGLILAELYGLGVPASLVSHLGDWKEALGISVVLAGVANFISSGQRADALDRLALGFVALCAVYLAFQPQIVPGSPQAMHLRLLGFRETAGFVLLMLGVRHAPLGSNFLRRATRVLMFCSVIIAGVAIYETVDSSGWNSFVVSTIGYTRYQAGVLNSYRFDENSILTYGYLGGARVLRAGSVFLNPSFLSWYLLPPFAISIERYVRRRAGGGALLVLLFGVVEVLAQTRSALIGALLVVVLAVPHAAGRGRRWRTQVALLLAGLALVGIPTAVGVGLTNRLGQIGNSSNKDTAGHVNGLTEGLTTIAQRPLGLGLATGAGTGQRYDVAGDVIPENNYLEVGDELGVVGGLLFLSLTVVLIVWLRRLSQRRPEVLVTAIWSSGVGLAVSALFLQTWSSLTGSWTYWALAGAVLGAARYPLAQGRQVAPASEPPDRDLAPTTSHVAQPPAPVG